MKGAWIGLFALLVGGCTVVSKLSSGGTGTSTSVTVENDGEKYTVTESMGRGPRIDASGPVTKETREVGNFTGIQNSGAIDVRYEPGAQGHLVVEAPRDLLPYLSTKVKGGTLVIEPTRDYETHSRLTVVVQGRGLLEAENGGSGSLALLGIKAPTFKLKGQGSGNLTLEGTADKINVDLNGSGEAQLSGLAAKTLDALIEGSGSIKAKGTASQLGVELNGSGGFDGGDLKTENLKANVSGSGSVNACASKSVNATVNGSGGVTVTGNPPQVTKSVNGSGKVTVR